jgi:hypothetical protein
MDEHFSSLITWSPDHFPSLDWYTREKAALGNTFINLPYGFPCRNPFGYINSKRQIDERSLIHHLPNNYANDPSHPYAKLPVDALVDPPLTFSTRNQRNVQSDGSVYILKPPGLGRRMESMAKKLRASVSRAGPSSHL